ncbi:hypothetical protein [Candidatus Vampirococcus lugosii]|uniref:Glutathionylspermidine synthase pre-ATP-grasp-like domain-containing protein n=1 Tax=Candidatus Vampirococcus lugosii TaxID=2789015 RepID=A0ABS5QNF4_9BACT|nr:hypothetical protein [Candidatus Vampirococcus lugosii]MBS8122228.1 hypothetical protein [Candidatus Vampirococcus lugosii]
MSNSKYKDFWSKMKLYYPISKGEIKLPIANKLMSNEYIISDLLIKNCKYILEEIMKIDKSKKIKFMNQNNEGVIQNLFQNNYTGVVRFDCMLDQNNNIKIIELNSDYPDGLLMHDNTYSVLLNEEKNLHKNNFLKFFDKNEKIFILYPEGVFFKDAYYTEYFFLKENGFNVNIGTFSELDFNDDGIYYKGIKIDKIRRCLETSKLSIKNWEKFYKYKIDFINTFDMWTLGYKELLSEIKHSYILEKLDVNEENKNKIIKNKDFYVIKASNGIEGGNIYIGKDIKQSDWQKIIETNLNTNFIAQEFVEAQKNKINFFQEDKIISKEVYFDVCPHFFIKNGDIISEGLILTRFSESKILNVAKGGGIGYLKTI